MWDTVENTGTNLSHDLPCFRCEHAAHTYLPCSDTCDCEQAEMPGEPTPRLEPRREIATAA
jgi:hypothetical protein